MDPFGDGNGDEQHDLSNFQAPADATAYNGDFYEVDATEGTSGSYDYNHEQPAETEQYNHYEEQQEPEQSALNNSNDSNDTPVSYMSYTESTPSYEASPAIPVVEEENELTKFMRAYEQQIAEKAVEQEKVAVECKEKAAKDMEKFQAERVRIKESKQQANRVKEQATLEKLVADLQNENPWERVVTLVELEANRKQKLAALNAKKDSKNADQPKPVAKKEEEEEDISRMRQLFVQLKAQPLEKTRSGSVTAH